MPAEQYKGPIASTADAGAGETAFGDLCASCHPGGKADLGPKLVGKGLSPGMIRHQVREGSGRMPPFGPSKLSDQELEDMLAYLDTLDAVGEPAGAAAAAPSGGSTSEP
jgi:mono/diheme cytochrome c family protein